MTEIIYADILVVINIYVTYFLLRLSIKITQSKLKTLRLVLSSIIGGFYSLILLIPNINDLAISISRIVVSIFLVLIANKIHSLKHFFKLIFTFYALNFAFAGMMFAIWFCAKPSSMLYNNGILYFGIDTVSLLVITIICYILLSIGQKIFKSKAPCNVLYELTIYVENRIFLCRAFLDTGNFLNDPFTNLPVIIVNENVFKSQIHDLSTMIENGKFINQTLRLIPCSTIAESSFIMSFKPQKIEVKGIEVDFSCEEVYIGITKNKILSGEFDAILSAQIFQNMTNERGKDYESKNYNFVAKH